MAYYAVESGSPQGPTDALIMDVWEPKNAPSHQPLVHHQPHDPEPAEPRHAPSHQPQVHQPAEPRYAPCHQSQDHQPAEARHNLSLPAKPRHTPSHQPPSARGISKLIFGFAIVVAVTCNPVYGLIAIGYSILSLDASANGDMDKAESYDWASGCFSLCGVGTFVVFLVILVLNGIIVF